MKDKNGFTLIELIGIIVILGVLVVIGVPSLLKNLNNNKNKEYETFEKNLFLAAESYIQKRQELYPNLSKNNGTVIVSINALIDDGLIKNNMVNPKTDEKIDLSGLIKVINVIDKEKNTSYYTYEYLPINELLESQKFAYKEEIQEFTAKKTGFYKLETWGAQGGSVTDNSGKLYEGGYGAYASGIVELNANDVLYIFTGGSGKNQNDEPSNNIITGGYNGGGSAYDVSGNLVASGGGATQISMNPEELFNLKEESNDILLVAAGGGGAFKNSIFSASGGHGGGYKGSTSLNPSFNKEDGICVSPEVITYHNYLNNTGNGDAVDIETFINEVMLDPDVKKAWSEEMGSEALNKANTFGYYCISNIQDEDQSLFKENGFAYQVLSHFGHGSLQQNDYYDDFSENSVQDILNQFDSGASGGGGGYYGGGLGYNTGGNGGFSHVNHPDLQDNRISCYKCDTNEDYFTYGVSKVSKDPVSNYAKKGNGYAKITYLGF